HEAGARTDMHMPYERLVGLIRDAGKTPVERDSLYQVVRTDFSELTMPRGGETRATVPVVHAA
ncbi:MAG: hypothetical protein ACREK8_05950, partial [Gemmatimonadales bacterium]